MAKITAQSQSAPALDVQLTPTEHASAMRGSSSFECLQNKWIKKVTEEAEQGCHICLVGTKLDLIQSQPGLRAVRQDEVLGLAAKYNAHVFETSAKVGQGVGEIFDRIVEQFHARVMLAYFT
mmetsp:Transcript_17978/g.43012  ORF Transcript_17978/g.43012 Transcript_17978/m.43012 type:complete len:122 (-) Transcript_17978:593-958(-)